MKAKNIIITGLFIALLIAGCKKDETTTPVETFTRTDYIGNWACTEVPLAKKLNFDCTISLDAASTDHIKISNFANLNGDAVAAVNGNIVSLPKQTINGNTVEGSGKMENKNFITWQYYVKDNTDSLVYNTTFNRK